MPVPALLPDTCPESRLGKEFDNALKFSDSSGLSSAKIRNMVKSGLQPHATTRQLLSTWRLISLCVCHISYLGTCAGLVCASHSLPAWLGGVCHGCGIGGPSWTVTAVVDGKWHLVLRFGLIFV